MAAAGPDPERQAQAEAELAALAPPPEEEAPVEAPDPRLDPAHWLEQGWRAKEAGELAAARVAFGTAAELGADPQRIALELAWLDLDRGDCAAARSRLEEAATGPDDALAAQAEAQLALLPRHLWADLYGEAWAWWRLAPASEADLVPFVRARGFWTPWLGRDLHLYLALAAARDLASRGAGDGVVPVIYADNAMILAPGVLARFWDTRIGVWAQAGPALMLVDDGGSRWRLDARIGASVIWENAACRPYIGGDVCAEAYSEVVYVSRYDHDVLGMARGRTGITPLVWGQVAWQPLLELRVFADVNGDYWNNLVDAGLVHRWRFLESVPIDISLGVHAGRYLRGAEGTLPDPAGFLDLRLTTAGYFQF
ncbi:MAG: hypothetical protein ABIO70_02115 [Pseudomonadota bacterium]